MQLDLLLDGVHAWFADRSGHGNVNAGVIVDPDGTITVVDPRFTAAQSVPFAAAVADLGGRVSRVVLSSSNAEFCGGTSMFRLAAIYGRRQTSDHLDQPADPQVLRQLYPDQAPDIDDEFATRPVSHVIDAPVQVTSSVVLYPLTGQQAENLVTVVPDAGVVFAGAMCSFGVTPLAYQGDPAAWAESLDLLLRLAPVVVPGHGPVGGEEEVRVLQDYLAACVAADGVPSAMARGPWDRWADPHNTAVNVERAALLARGEDRIPDSFLRRLGL